jgi:two-component system, NtrC family, nitrogen regulation sensor histidine kinase NtrY
MNRQLKSAIYTLALAMLLLLVAAGGNDWFRRYDLSKDTQKLRLKLEQINQSFDRVTDNDSIINDIIAKGFETPHFEQLQKLPYGFLVYKDNNLFFWNKSNIIPPVNISISLPDGNTAAKFLNGYYYVSKKTIFNGDHGYSLLALYLLKHDYKIQNQYLRNTLNDDLNLPPFLSVSFDSTALASPFKNNEGRTIFYLGKDIFRFNNYPHKTLITLYAAGGILLLLSVLMFTFYLLNHKNFESSLAFLAAGIFAVRFVGVYFNLPFELSKLDIFNPVYYASSVVNKSLGDWLLNVLAFFALSYYLFRYAPNRMFSKAIARYPKLFFFLFYTVSLLISYSMGVMFRSLLTNSNIPFDLNNFLDLNIYSILGIIGLALMLFSYGMFLLKMILMLDDFSGKYYRSALMAAALALHAGLMFLLNESYVFYAGAIWTVIFLLFLYDFRKQYKTGFPFTSLMMVITFFAVFSAIHIYHNNNTVEEYRKLSFARNIAQSEDPITEYLFLDIQDKIMKDRSVRNYFLKPFISKKDIIERLKTNYLEGYLSKYETRVYMLNPEGGMLLSDDKDFLVKLNNELLENARETGTENLFFIPLNNGGYSYLSNITIIDDERIIGTIIILLNPKMYYRSNLYPELLLEDHIKTTGKFESFSFAEYTDDKLFNKNGNYPYNFRYNLTDTLTDEYTYVKEDNLKHIIYNTGDGKKVVITSLEKTFIQPVTLFSYLFVFFLLFVAVVVMMRIIKRSIEDKYYLRSIFSITLKNKIQLSMISMIVISFLITGVVTIEHFISKYGDTQRERLLRKEEAVRTDIGYAISDNPRLLLGRKFNTLESPQEKGVLNLSVLSEIHAIDINIYNLDGQIINTSQPDIFEKGLFSPVMDPLALRNLLYKYKIQFFMNENIGSLQYSALYAPVRDKDGELLAYLNLPYFAKEKELKKEISSFLVTLINVYVLMLVFGGFLAYILSDSITRSLSVLSERFNVVRLGKKNEPIQWESNDEIGILVNKYNQMIEELESSAELLAKSEREMAWREMAKQIAHEIKNPLTPMKLSIQMLQRAMKENRPDVMQLSEKVTNTLVEQIDNLSQIATEFSSFAKMPQSYNEQLQLEEIIQSAVNLVSLHDDFDITFIKPENPVQIFADKNQLLRAFGNLIKNAHQAIPPNRKGSMTISTMLNEKYVTVLLKDNGSGIPRDVQPKVFTPNFTTKTSGMGLGLAITKQIIEEGAGGKIWFETKENEGTTFFVKFPLSRQ